MGLGETVDILSKVRFGVIIVGLLGNITSFVIFSRKSFQKNSISIYCRALAVSDSFIILFQIIGDIGLIFFNVNLYSTSDALCKLSTYIYVGLPPVCGWIIVAFSLDKLISVLSPNRYELIRKRTFQFSVIGFIVVFNALLYSEVPIDLNLSQIPVNVSINGTNQVILYPQCIFQSLSYYKVINILYLVEGSLIPFLFMIATTVIITKSLISSRTRLELHERRFSREMKSRRNRDFKFSLNSIILNILYILLQFPVTLTYLIPIEDQTTYYTFYLTTVVFYFMNFSIPFFTYLISNSIFRRELLYLFGFKSELSSTHPVSISNNQMRMESSANATRF